MNNVAEHAREQKAGMKCPQCGEAVFFPPVVSRIA